jgi:arylsulfatase A-like enzyme
MNESAPRYGVTRRDFLLAMGALATAGAPLLGGSATTPPNVVLILADDLGYDSLGCQGSPDLHTPHIDSIAAAGVRFTDGYVPCPVCAPTRASLLTGRYPQSFGFEFNFSKTKPAAANPCGLPLSEKTLANHLHAAGYATGIIGKWHLGFAPKFNPLRRGFDEFFGFLGGSRSYYQQTAREPLYSNDQVVTESEYLTDAFARKAESFIERHRDEPFFLYLPFNAVHHPADPPPREYFEGLAPTNNRTRRNFAAIVSALDAGVGRVLHAIQRRGLEKQTLVIFLSDNGGTVLARTHPINVRGDKGSLYEGGIRIPFMMKWPGQIAPATLYHNPVCAFDLFATILKAAGRVPPANCDGVDLLPFLAPSAAGRPHETLYWKYGDSSAIRHGDWKLLNPSLTIPPMLFNLAGDTMELNDRVQQERALVAQLSAMLNDFKALLPRPRWQPTSTALG